MVACIGMDSAAVADETHRGGNAAGAVEHRRSFGGAKERLRTVAADTVLSAALYFHTGQQLYHKKEMDSIYSHYAR